jgi:hypothetical protein
MELWCFSVWVFAWNLIKEEKWVTPGAHDGKIKKTLQRHVRQHV